MPKKSKFISMYVNEMYAIIVGLGIANIVFNENFVTGEIIDYVMVAFTTFVVLLYWWDWAEYIETEIATTKVELFIDFMILLNLEMLFVFYNLPIQLATAFITLGILDLIWVANHIREVLLEKKSTSIGIAKWILEKLLVILLYLISFVIVSSILFDPYTRWIQSIVIIIIFVIVRNIGFIHIRKSRKYFVLATKEFTQAILEINHSYQETRESGGFLLKKLDSAEIEDAIEAGRIFIVKGEEKVLLGYAIVTSEIEEDLMQDILWENDAMKNKLLDSEFILLDQIATKRDQRRKGIAEFLIESLRNEFPDKPIASFIAILPFTNHASLELHEKLAFTRVATFNRPSFSDLQDYESYLLVLFDSTFES